MDFKSAEKKFQSVESAYRSGRLSDHDYQAAVNRISVQDEDGRWWKIQPYSGQWHVHELGKWKSASPPHVMQKGAVSSEIKEKNRLIEIGFYSGME